MRAQRSHRLHAVAHEDHGRGRRRRRRVAPRCTCAGTPRRRRQNLVDEQDLGLEVRGDGEGEAHVHAARVALHRRVDEALDPGEVDDLVEARARSRAASCPRIAPFRKMFSRPVSSGWKPVPTSSSVPTRPCSSMRPVGRLVIRASTFSSVLLPAPFGPMMPTDLALPRSRTRRRAAPRTVGSCGSLAVGDSERRRQRVHQALGQQGGVRARSPRCSAFRGARRRLRRPSIRSRPRTRARRGRSTGFRRRLHRYTTNGNSTTNRETPPREHHPAIQLEHADHRVERTEHLYALGDDRERIDDRGHEEADLEEERDDDLTSRYRTLSAASQTPNPSAVARTSGTISGTRNSAGDGDTP